MGVSVAFLKHGEIIHKSQAGIADFKLKLPVEAETRFRIASISKSMTTANLMVLYD